MSGWHRGVQSVQRNSLHGHLLHDLFGAKRRGLAVVREYLLALYHIMELLQFQSTFINDYFYELWLSRTKYLFRATIKFFITASLLFILEPGLLCPFSTRVIRYAGMSSTLFFLMFYLFTFRQISYTMYETLSTIIILIHMIMQYPIRCNAPSRNTPLPLPMYVTIFAAFVMLPLNMELSTCIIVVFITIHEGLDVVYDHHRRDNHSQVETTDPIPWKHFDISRLTIENNILIPRSVNIITLRAFMWILICFIALYLRFWNTARRRFAFFKLGKSVQSRNQCNKAHHGKVCWIEAIVPWRVSEEYQRLRKINETLPITDWIYIKTYEDVSILFADIVGFTKMSSRLPAPQVVILLGELIRQFDELCETKHCEKLGVLGDCYYCVSGCPEPQTHHARCCTEMGLGMCEILKTFNLEHEVPIDIRVGIHTGRVHAAVIGAERFHFDVYSYDVIIANELEATGRPGFVHISQATLSQLHSSYEAIPGPELFINRKDSFGWARKFPDSVQILTYFIEPASTNIRETIFDIIDRNAKESRNPSVTEQTEPSALGWSSFGSADSEGSDFDLDAPSSGFMWMESEMYAEALADIKLSHQTNVMNLKRDVALIHDLRADPAKHHLLFRTPPLHPLSLFFRNAEIEWHYQLHLRQSIGPTFVDSEKLARVGDATVILVVIMVLSFLGIMGNLETASVTIYLSTILSALFIFGTLWYTGTTYPESIKSKYWRGYYYLFTNPIVRELTLGVYTCLPTAVAIGFRHTYLENDHSSVIQYIFTSFTFMSVLIHCIPSSSAAWARCVFAMISLILSCMDTELLRVRAEYNGKFCLSGVVIYNGLSEKNSTIIFMYQLLVCLFLVFFLCRESERTCKLCFFVHREAEIESEAAEKAVTEANELLYNIIPIYVFQELQETGKEDLSDRKSSLRYAVAHSMIGVSFISISNFFPTLYREDHEGGADSLKLLHRIMCTFDLLIHNFTYVEKIKSMRENYLIAAGLNRKLIPSNSNTTSHLKELLQYCLMARDKLRTFSEEELEPGQVLVAKIGYNCGPVTAGIIGVAKPHYDIWGDTVNVASRMCYTGQPGLIQVTERAKVKLENQFLFTYRGEFFVKGKGMMRTYACDGLL